LRGWTDAIEKKKREEGKREIKGTRKKSYPELKE